MLNEMKNMYHIFIIMSVLKITFSLTCQDVLELPEEQRLNLHQLQSIPPKEIVRCVSHLGREELSQAEAEFIWKAIIEFHNGTANIPEEVLVSLHYVTIAVKPKDYANITLDNVDVISNFGLNYDLTNEQLDAIAGRVRKDFGSKEPEDYNFYDLTALGQILCVFNKSEIDRIHPKAYKEAAVLIGKLKNCNYEAMKGFANLATKNDAFGSPAFWTETTVNELGAVFEYLPKEVISKLGSRLG